MLKVKITKAYIVEVLDENSRVMEQRIIETDHKSYAELVAKAMKGDWQDILDERKRIGLAEVDIH